MDSNTLIAIMFVLYLLWHVTDAVRDVLLDRRGKKIIGD